MAKTEATPAIDEVSKKTELILTILGENKTFGAAEVVADKRFQKAYPGAKANTIGRLLGSCRETLGIANPKDTASTGKRKKSGKDDNEPITLDDMRDALDFVNNNFAGNFDKAVGLLEGISKIGSIERTLETLKAIDEMDMLRKKIG